MVLSITDEFENPYEFLWWVLYRNEKIGEGTISWFTIIINYQRLQKHKPFMRNSVPSLCSARIRTISISRLETGLYPAKTQNRLRFSVTPSAIYFYFLFFRSLFFRSLLVNGINLLTRVASIFPSIFHRQLLFGNSKIRFFEVYHRLQNVVNSSSWWLRRQCHFLVTHDNEEMCNVHVMPSSSSSAAFILACCWLPPTTKTSLFREELLVQGRSLIRGVGARSVVLFFLSYCLCLSLVLYYYYEFLAQPISHWIPKITAISMPPFRRIPGHYLVCPIACQNGHCRSHRVTKWW
jgi:hypothetical protein